MSLLAHRRRENETDPAEGARVLAGPRYIYRNLLVANDGVWAWYQLSPVQWRYRSDADREVLLESMRTRFAALAGHRIHLRVTNQPIGYDAWAKRLHAASPKRLADVRGAETWADYLRSSQEQIRDARMVITTTYLGVRLLDRPVPARHLPRAFTTERAPAVVERLRKVNTRITQSVAGEGFGGRRMTSRGLGWLLADSSAIGVPVNGNDLTGDRDQPWEGADLDLMFGQTDVTSIPMAGIVQVEATRGGTFYRGYAAALTAGRMKGRDGLSKALQPWIAYGAGLEYPTQWSAILDVQHGKDLEAAYTTRRKVAENQVAHRRDFGQRPQGRELRQIEAALRVEDEVASPDAVEAVRISGQWRLAVAHATEDGLRELVADVSERYAREQGITLVHTHNQEELLAEFIPGVGRASTGGHVRVMPTKYVVTAVPHAASGLGDDTGPYFARVVGGGRQPVMLDPSWGPQHNMSGLIPVIAGLGGGKSVAAGAMIEPSVRRGHRTTVFDGVGSLGALERWVPISKDTRVIELSSARQGTLNPYRMVPDPLREDYASEGEYDMAVREAQAERTDLMVDVLLMLLPYQLVTQSIGAQSAVQAAVRTVGGDYTTDPWDVVAFLERGGDVARDVASMLTDAAGMKGGSLIFPNRSGLAKRPNFDPSEALLTILTMRGLTAPTPGSNPSTWTRAEAMAVPAQHLAARYALRAMYADKEPKLIVSDEIGITSGESGAGLGALNTRISLDSRRNNSGVALIGQNPSHLTRISPEIANLAGCVLVGRLNSLDAAQAAARILGMPEGQGYEQVLLTLPSGGKQAGHFVMRDWTGRIGTIRVDLSHRPGLLDVLNTTPPNLFEAAADLDLVEALA